MQNIIILAVIGLLLGLGVGQGIKLISLRVESKLRAGAYCCILGVVATMVMFVIGYFLYFRTGGAIRIL